jgi:hypothetical protein
MRQESGLVMLHSAMATLNVLMLPFYVYNYWSYSAHPWTPSWSVIFFCLPLINAIL